MLVSDFDYELPPALIAQAPTEKREASRLMLMDRASGALDHGRFSDLPEYLRPGDVLVVNDTRVFPARLTGVRPDTGGRVETLLLKDLGGGSYRALTRGNLPVGSVALLGERLTARVVEDLGGGKKVITFDDAEGLELAIEELGRMPLPPYIDQSQRDERYDRERYQTVYAKKRGAVAAPTAGLHFTDSLLVKIREIGVEVAPVTLHVGIGTFTPVREDIVEDHVMDTEEYEISLDTAEKVNAARREGRRVVAVGTTSLRALESAASPDGFISAGESSTGIFIYPGYSFRVVDALVTNFHLPKSTLLMLVCAFAGRDNTLAAYATAVREGYRFYSYGDAMFIGGSSRLKLPAGAI